MVTQTLEQLDAFSAAEFKDWLYTELGQKHDPDPEVRYRACDLRHLDISLGETYYDVFHGLMPKLSEPARVNVRAALTELFLTAKLDEFPYEVMRDIVALVHVTDARQAVQHFESFCDGPWGERHPDLKYDCVAVILGFGMREEFERLRVKYGFR